MHGTATYMVGAATALLAVVWLMFLTWSRTLVFASSMDTLALVAAVDRERENLSTPACLGVPGMRIFATVRDMLGASGVAVSTTTTTTCSRRLGGEGVSRVSFLKPRGCFT